MTFTNTASNDNNSLQVLDPTATVRLTGGLAGSGFFNDAGQGKTAITGANPISGAFYTGGYGSTDLLADGTGVGTIAAAAFNVYYNQFRVGPGFVLRGTPSLAVDTAVARIEHPQTLSGLSVGFNTSPVNADATKLPAPGVTLTLTYGVTTAFGTVQANLAGDWTVFNATGFTKAGVYQNSTQTSDGSVSTVSGASTFVGRVTVEGGGSRWTRRA